MRTLLECIRSTSQNDVKNEFKRAISGLSFNESIITHADTESVCMGLFAACSEMNTVNESAKNILDCIGEAERGESVDEGIIGGILGAVGGIAFGPRIGNAICSALGISKGALYDLLNSRLVTTAICTKLGLRA